MCSDCSPKVISSILQLLCAPCDVVVHDEVELNQP